MYRLFYSRYSVPLYNKLTKTLSLSIVFIICVFFFYTPSWGSWAGKEPDESRPYKRRKEDIQTRSWEKVTDEYIVNNLHITPIVDGFMEVCPEGSNKSYLTLLWEKLREPQSNTLIIKTSITDMGG